MQISDEMQVYCLVGMLGTVQAMSWKLSGAGKVNLSTRGVFKN